MTTSVFAAAGRGFGTAALTLICIILFAASAGEVRALETVYCDFGECCSGGEFAPQGQPCGNFVPDECDIQETCTGTSEDCPFDEFAPGGTVCRPGSNDECDPTEVCSGGDPYCPSDVIQDSSYVCNYGSGDICDPDETCTGNPGEACPSDNYDSGNTVCNEGTGDVCDPDEYCTGFPDSTCPVDEYDNGSTLCNPGTGDACDPDQYCPGVPDSSCPADSVSPAGTVCRKGSGDACDPAEVCSGTPLEGCPADVLQPQGTLCRAGSGDLCDPNEYCTGTSGDSCPFDVVRVDGYPCNPGAGFCDPTETCTGTAGETCPIDYVRPAGTVCRPGSGDFCDPDEVCTGTADELCPTDFVRPAGTECRASQTGDLVCDPAEVCTGTPRGDCPIDFVEPVTTACGDSSDTECTDPDTCDGLGECADNHVPCGLFTDSSLCDFDAEPDKGVCEETPGGTLDGKACSLAKGNADCGGGTCVQSSQFRLAFSPDMQGWVSYKLNASTPGQFFYNLMHDASGATTGTTLYIGIPYPFVTQGATPLHVYDADLVQTDTNGCFAPPAALMGAATVVDLEDWIQGAGYSPPDYILDCTKVDDGIDDHDNGTDICVIEVVIPQAIIDATLNGRLYVNLHVDYGLKGPGVDGNDNDAPDRYDQAGSVSPWKSADALFNTDTNSGPVAIEDCSDHRFFHADENGDIQDADGAENLNVFKKAAGAFGRAYCEDDGDALAGYVQLRRYPSGSVVYTTPIDADGYYRAAYVHKGKATQYYLAWCSNAACTTQYDTTGPFYLQANGVAEVDLVDLVVAPCDGTPADLDAIHPIYATGKFKF